DRLEPLVRDLDALDLERVPRLRELLRPVPGGDQRGPELPAHALVARAVDEDHEPRAPARREVVRVAALLVPAVELEVVGLALAEDERPLGERSGDRDPLLAPALLDLLELALDVEPLGLLEDG